jgi:hypothetical protein
MKCIYCKANSDYKSRQPGGRCRYCNREFAFEPKTESYKLTDLSFQAAIETISYQGQLKYTRRQLWYEVNRRLWRRRMVGPRAFIGTLVAAFLLSLFLGPSYLLTGAILILVTSGLLAWNYYVKIGPRQQPIMPLEHFAISLGRWRRAHGEPVGLIADSDQRIAIDLRGEEADLTDYGFDRLVITEHVSTAAMLLANMLHIEKKCAILCAQDLSSEKAELILRMIQHNPQLKVLAIHDASIEGCGLAITLRQEPWFHEDSVELIDLGLRPEQAKKLRLFKRKGVVSRNLVEDARTKHLAPEEVEWLEKGNFAELEGLRPRPLLRAISRGFSLADEADSNGELHDELGFDIGEDILWIESFG